MDQHRPIEEPQAVPSSATPSPTRALPVTPAMPAPKPKSPFTWAHITAYCAALALVILTFFPWFSPSSLLTTVNTQSQQNILSLFLGNTEPANNLNAHYSLASFESCANTLESMANNNTALMLLAQADESSALPNGGSNTQNGSSVAGGEGQQVAYGKPMSVALNGTLDSLISQNLQSKMQTIKEELEISATTMHVVTWTWLFTLALLIVGVALSLLKRHFHAPMVVLIAGALTGLISLWWVTSELLILSPAGFSDGISLAPLLSLVASLVIVMVLTVHHAGPIATLRAQKPKKPALDSVQGCVHT